MEQERSAALKQMSSLFLQQNAEKEGRAINRFLVIGRDGSHIPLDLDRMRRSILWAALSRPVDVELVIAEALKNLFDGVNVSEITDALVLAVVGLIERDPVYGFVAARLLFKKLFREVTHQSAIHTTSEDVYRNAFVNGIERGVAQGIFDKRMAEFDLVRLSQALVIERDHLFDYMGLRTLYERYFAKTQTTRIELPQVFWMRVAMGLCYNEPNKNERAIEFYNLMSSMRYLPGTPTLLHSGLLRPQLSSCFLTTVGDDLHVIFKSLSDNAQLSKFSGGVANDWTPLRATGSMINTIRMESQGVIPFLKIANDVTAAISRSGSRRGATVVYLETWHFDIEDFLDLRRNTGDERRRAHDMNTANWVPDLFMKRVIEDADWTLFSPDEVPDLHDLYGKAFEERYAYYEEQARLGNIRLYKVMPALQLWRKMLSRLFETGHPWITFKDACNVRSPQDHVGVVHSSNLCTEITLNTSADEIAVCNLGSVNLSQHVLNGALDDEKLAHTVTTAIRMLDNVIDINFYPVAEAKNSNWRHRPVGLGLMGLQDFFYKIDVNFDDARALDVASDVMEKISYHAIMASSQLAQERGTYSTYKGSKWDRGILPQDTIDMLEHERGMSIEVAREGKLDWTPVREQVKRYGMRNSNTMAIAPTATISNIAGTFPCIEPIYKNIYVKANMSGEFTVINTYLIEDLKALGLWDQDMLDELKYYDGNLQMIERIPQRLRNKYKEVFEIDPFFLVRMSALRGRFIDQSQSHNVFMRGTSGKILSDVYIAGWKAGMKTFYYLRTLGATQIEKATLDAKKFGFTQKREYKTLDGAAPAAAQVTPEIDNQSGRACNLLADPSCESCQ